MPDKTSAEQAADIITTVEALRKDVGMADLRKDIEARWLSHAGGDVPWLPPQFTQQGDTAFMPSFRVQYLAQVLGAFMAAYPTTTTVNPGGPELQTKADKLERALALVRASLFPEELDAEMRWHQMISGPGVYRLCCDDPNDPNGGDKPWHVEVLDPTSVYFPMSSDFRPKIVGREYTMLVREMQEAYGQAATRNKQELNADANLTKKDGNWFWTHEAVSLDTATYGVNSALNAGTAIAAFERCHVVELDDGKTTTIVVRNQGALGDPVTTGEIVWQYENLVGGTHYVIVPGHVTGARNPRERLLPYLWAQMNVVDQITFVRTIRATRITTERMRVLVERNPDFFQAGVDLGVLAKATEAQVQAATDVMEFNGQPYHITRPPDDDMAKLEDSLIAEYNEMASTQLSVTTSDVVKEGTLGAQQLSVGVREKQQGPMLGYKDKAQKIIMEMVEKSILHENGYVPNDSKGWGFNAKGGERFSKGELKAGMRIYLTKDLIDFEHDIGVTTASKTDEQIQIAFQAALMQKQAGFATTDEVLTARGVQDIDAWLINKAEDEAYEAAGTLMGPNIYAQTLQERARLRAGVFLQVPGMMPPPDMGAPSGGAPASVPGQRPTPATSGVEATAGAAPGGMQ